MEGKKSFLLYADLIEVVSDLPMEKRGELFTIILQYVNDENPVITDPVLKMAFIPVKQNLKRDLLKWQKVVERNRENGKKGGRPPKENPKNPVGKTGTQKNPKNPDEPKKADNDNDNDNDIINEDSHNEIFRKLWKSDIWIESLCTKWKCGKKDLQDHLNYFRQDCIDKEELKVDEKDAKRHFINWVNKGHPVTSAIQKPIELEKKTIDRNPI